ncbi:hypothetical protein ACFL0J_06680, partial [Candidatus Neomarinimicrobiota bacterium]
MKILYILSCPDIFGGTARKTLNIIKNSDKNSIVYFYSEKFNENVRFFENEGVITHRGYFGRNIYRHVNKLIQIIDKNNIDIVQTQFSMGTILGNFIKLFRPQIKLILTFEGSSKPNILKSLLVKCAYKKSDAIVYISK